MEIEVKNDWVWEIFTSYLTSDSSLNAPMTQGWFQLFKLWPHVNHFVTDDNNRTVDDAIRKVSFLLRHVKKKKVI